ncbi:MAG: DUF5680 domain-containing protein [Chitinophagales bacterium]
MNTEQLRQFIVAANKATYAGDGPRCASLLPGSRQLEFSDGEYLYRDVYFGSDRFQGQSVVYFRGRPVWGMVYSGGVTADHLSPEAEVYAFLKKALARVPPDEPFRGPRHFSEGDWVYENAPSGTSDRFAGREEIRYGGESVYRLHYAGGLIVGRD